MNQIHYTFIQERNEKVLSALLNEKKFQLGGPPRNGLRTRLLFVLSDIFLGFGAWLRPEDIRIFLPEKSLDECEPQVNCS